MLCSEKVKLFAREHPCGEATVDGTRYRYPGVSDGDVILPTAGHITSFQIRPDHYINFFLFVQANFLAVLPVDC